jgi:(S)-citramalyl-CoA lyase
MAALTSWPLLCRSILNTPALDASRFIKATEAGADMGLLDLEDPIPPELKEHARHLAVAYYTGPHPDQPMGVRINSLRSEDGLRDVLALLDGGARPDYILVPKVESPHELRLLDEILSSRMPDVPLLALIETARGVKEVEEIALATPRLCGLVFGAADMAAQLGAARTWEALLYARSRIVYAAALGKLCAIDSPFFDLADEVGLAREVRLGRELGFSGKISIHPKQIPIIHAEFTPSPEAVAHAQEVVDRATESEGQIYVVQGRMIGPPIIASAKKVLALAGRSRK